MFRRKLRRESDGKCYLGCVVFFDRERIYERKETFFCSLSIKRLRRYTIDAVFDIFLIAVDAIDLIS